MDAFNQFNRVELHKIFIWLIKRSSPRTTKYKPYYSACEYTIMGGEGYNQFVSIHPRLLIYDSNIYDTIPMTLECIVYNKGLIPIRQHPRAYYA